jgi:hypothetical protein
MADTAKQGFNWVAVRGIGIDIITFDTPFRREMTAVRFIEEKRWLIP